MKLPKWLQRVKDVWMAFSHAIGFVVSKILLTTLWVIVFGLYHLIGMFIPKKDTGGWQSVPKDFDGSLQHQF